MHSIPRWTLGLVPALLLLVDTGRAAEPTLPPAQQVLYSKARAVLEGACFSCHSHAANKSKGGLMLDSRAAILKGGDSGAAIDEKVLKKSLLLHALSYEHDELRMPPKGKLPAESITTLTTWIKAGAPWPDNGSKLVARPRGGITDEDRKWWAFQPIGKPNPPVVAGAWNASAIDRFVKARLDAEKLTPAPSADARTLLRRITFDLTGLPPTPEEVVAFEAASSKDANAALEALVDRLLASPAYGERMARVWLDLVRYAESDGFKADDYRPHAWRYRDYVIRAFNSDKPYDAFLREQLAGDELAPENSEARLATSFLRLGIYEYNNRDVRTQWNNMIDEPTEVVGDVFLGLGMGCAKCHDHKFDPILQADYFRLRAFFEPLMPRDRPLVSAAEEKAHREKLAIWEKSTATIREQIAAIEKPLGDRAAKGSIGHFPPDIQALFSKADADRTPLERQLHALAYRQVDYDLERIAAKATSEQKEKLIALRKELTKFDAQKPAALPLANVVGDIGPDAPPTLFGKKNPTPVAPGFLTLLDPTPAKVEKLPELGSTGRRSALAKWLSNPENPLTGRVLVNRLWQMHFGRGLVATTSDFGKLGEPPSHPELLDWLTRDFVENGWSLKRMHRQMVLSLAYRQSAKHPNTAPGLKVDPENLFLWRHSTRRLEAEQIRDAILSATGKLDRTASGPGVDSSIPRRSIYTRMYRNQRDGIFEVFDAPDGIGSVPQRNTTTTPTQSLLLINGVPLIEQARGLAHRLEKHASDDAGRIEHMYQLLYGRSASDREQSRLQRFLAEQATKQGPRPATDAPVVEQLKMPHRDGKALVVHPRGSPWLRVEEPQDLPDGDFTVEAYVLLRSTYEDGTVRPIAVHHNGDVKSPGWAFGVTGAKSAYKPQALVMQLWGKSAEKGAGDYEAVFSDLRLELDRPYYVAVSVKLTTAGKESVTFHAKDLSNDDEPVGLSKVSHRITSFTGKGPMSLGGAISGKNERVWDGLLDDVRLSKGALAADQLLLVSEVPSKQTTNFWQFEAKPGLLKDTTSTWHLLQPLAKKADVGDPRHAALVDLCHVLLNTSEFLYVD